MFLCKKNTIMSLNIGSKTGFRFVKIFLLSFIIAVSGCVFSQTTLTLLVTDEHMAPIEGAVVFINDDPDTQAVSDANGLVEYQLQDGSYVVFSYAADFLDHVSYVTIQGESKTLEVVHQPAVFWSTAPANPPVGVGEANGVRLAVADGKVYLHAAFGGTPGTTQYGAIPDFYVYDPETDTWSQLPNAPHFGLYGITTAHGPTLDGGDAIYILRGYWTGQRTWMARFNIEEGVWETGLNHQIPWRLDLGNQYSGDGFQNYPRNGAVMVWDHADHIYLFPGSGYSYEKYDWYRYSVSNDSWEDLGALPHKQGPGNAAVLVKGEAINAGQDYIYVQFGLSPSGTYTAAEFWRFGLTDGYWENLADHDYGADDGSMLVWDGANYIYHTPGAYVEQPWDRGQDQKREMMRYSISGNYWTHMEPAPYNRWGGWDDAGGIVRVGDVIYGLKGGSDVAWAEDGFVSGGGDIPSNKFWSFTLHANTSMVELLPPLGNGRIYPSPGAYTYQTGTENNFLAVPEKGWQFSEWQVNHQTFTLERSLELFVNNDKTIQAVFVRDDTGISNAMEEHVDVYSHGNRLFVTTSMPNKEVQVFDLTGRQHLNQSLAAEGKYEYELQLPAGTYVVMIKGGSGSMSRKIVVP
jgi:hypothetical protein